MSSQRMTVSLREHGGVKVIKSLVDGDQRLWKLRSLEFASQRFGKEGGTLGKKLQESTYIVS